MTVYEPQNILSPSEEWKFLRNYFSWPAQRPIPAFIWRIL